MAGREPTMLDDAACVEAASRLVAALDDPAPVVRHADRQWAAAIPANSAAFEAAQQVWRDLDLVLGDTSQLAPAPVVRRPPVWRRPLMALAAALLLGLFVRTWLAGAGERVLQTAVGQQKTVELADTSRVTLNTDTQLAVTRGKDRDVDLRRGEAMFDVATDAARPFTVHIGDRAVRAFGTEFIVRRLRNGVAVTLIEGKVDVTAPGMAPIRLLPGDRVSLNDAAPPARDRPPLDAVGAWRRGEVVFDRTAVPDAIAEMNRYNSLKIELASVRAGTESVNGVFKAGRSESFARTIASIYGLKIRREPGRLRLKEPDVKN